MLQLGQMVLDQCGRFRTVKQVAGDSVVLDGGERVCQDEVTTHGDFPHQWPREAREESFL